MQYSLKTEKRQDDSSKTEPYASRLREERLRLEPHQGKFAAKLGISQNRQSFLEKGERELRAEYLEQVAALGIDIQYIITGRRGGELLSVYESILLDSIHSLDEESRDAILLVVRRMADKATPAPNAE